MTAVPEGQLPRDAAFWRTHNAVLAEQARAFAVIECERKGHEMEWGVTGEEPRCGCGMTALEIYRLFEAQGKGRLVLHPDGASFTFQWGA